MPFITLQTVRASQNTQNNSVPACPLPNPSPKFGRGAPEFKHLSPFSQVWEKGLGDEGPSTLFTRDPLTFHYITAGKPTHPPLLLLHGFLGNHQDFSEILPALSQHFYCILPDLPGHGYTLTGSRDYRFLFMAQAISDLVDALDLRTIYLLGYSLGGRIALYLSCSFPGRYARTIIESASPGLKTAAERRDRRVRDHALARQLYTTALPDFLTQWYNNPLFASLKDHPDAYAAMYQRRLVNNPTSLGDVLHRCGLGHQPSLWQTLRSLDASPLHPDNSIRLFAGALDSKFVAINQEMVTCCPQTASLKIFAACGHNIHLEAPNTYAQAVIDYLCA